MKTSKAPKHVLVAALNDDDLLVHLKAANYWDAIQFGPGQWQNSCLMFGNANVGNLMLTNLQVGSQLLGGAMIVTNWYVRHNIENQRLWRLYAAHTYANLVIGDHPTWCSSLADMVTRTGKALLWPITIPVRQVVRVRLDTFNGAADQLVAIANSDMTPYEERPLVWIHLEGVMLPRELWDYPEESEIAESARRRYLALQAKVLRLLTATRKEQVGTAEHIARWIGSMSDDPAVPDEIRVQLTALADGVREERWQKAVVPADDAP